MTRKKIDKKITDILYRSFDDELTAKEQEFLANALEHSEELRREHQQIVAMRRMISEKGGGQFEPFFSARVMQRVNAIRKSPDRAAEFFESLAYMFKRVALVGGIAVIILFSIHFIQKEDNTHLASETVSEMTLDDVLGSAFASSLEEIL